MMTSVSKHFQLKTLCANKNRRKMLLYAVKARRSSYSPNSSQKLCQSYISDTAFDIGNWTCSGCGREFFCFRIVRKYLQNKVFALISPQKKSLRSTPSITGVTTV